MTRQGMAVLLSVVCATLAVAIYYELSAGPGDTPAAVVPTPPVGSTALPPQPPSKTLPPIDSLAEVTQRPLFSSTRQPPPQATTDSAGKIDGFFLTSIQLVGKERVALIQHGRPPVLARLV